MTISEWRAQTRAAQKVPEHVQDPVVLQRLVTWMRAAASPSTEEADAPRP